MGQDKLCLSKLTLKVILTDWVSRLWMQGLSLYKIVVAMLNVSVAVIMIYGSIKKCRSVILGLLEDRELSSVWRERIISR